MTRKQRRLTLIGVAGAVLAVAAGLVLFALSDKIVFFYSPTDMKTQTVAPGTRVRVGGLVENGSLVKGDNLAVSFRISDGTSTIPVTYRGLLPDLFREGQGVVAEGVIVKDGSVAADTVLAKHDERYMPREVVDALKKQGVWKEGQQ